MMSGEYELILCIVNAGFADTVMDAAHEYGARGGTVIQARGTANKEAEEFFKITIQPEKEMLMLVVPSAIKDDILHALYKSVGLNSPGHGIAFSLPIDNVLGLSNGSIAKKAPIHEGEKQKKEIKESENKKEHPPKEPEAKKE